jgi:hypothetical protein
VRKPERMRPFGRLRRRWKVILKYISKKWVRETWTGLIWLRIGAAGVLL